MKYNAFIEGSSQWYIAYCPEIPGANGQGKTLDERRESYVKRSSYL